MPAKYRIDAEPAMLRRLAEAAPFVRGTLRKRLTKCGKPYCRCVNGELHEAWSLTFSSGGKGRTIAAPEDMLEEVQQWTENYKRLQALVEEISAARVQLIVREHRSRREAKKRSRSK